MPGCRYSRPTRCVIIKKKKSLPMLTNIYLLTLLLCFICSLISFRLHYPFHLKLFSLLMGAAVLSEFFAYYGPKIWGYKNNLPVYNIYHLFEFCGVAYFYRFIIHNIKIKTAIDIFLIAYTLYWAVNVFIIHNIGDWNSNIEVVGGVFTVFLAATYCYRLFVSDELVHFRTSSEFWISVATIIYYSTMLPITGMFYYLTAHFTTLALHLTDYLKVANILMYSLIIYAYLCRVRMKKKLSP